MGQETQINAPGSSRLLRLFGLGGRDEEEPEVVGPGLSLHAERSATLSAISDFLLRHELAVSAENLARAHAIVTGSDKRFASKVNAREQAGDPITQGWLEDIDGVAARADPGEEYETLARSLEASVAQFGASTQSAQAAASSYGQDLQRHVDAVDQAHQAEDVVNNLALIARAMLDRTREMEAEMRRSEQEANKLRENLDKARRDANIDHLTNLPNRRAFEEVFRQERLECQCEMEPLCLAICDIDFFKKVNDIHGHDTGDRVIRAVGQALDRISDRCHVARHGGEEFVMLFRGMDLATAADTLDAARERFAARHFTDKISGKQIGEVTFSGGVVNVFAHPDLSTALRAADEALYRAKHAGRNRIEAG